MHVVITGARGFIGRRLVSRLENDGYKITTIVRAPVDATRHAKSIVWDGRQELALDTLDSNTALIDLAWDTRRRGEWQAQIDQLKRLELLTHRPVFSRVISLGSSNEFGSAEGRLPETARPMFPLSPYGWAKRAARELLHSRFTGTGIPVIWLRPFTVYGEGQGGEMLIPYAIKCARNRVPASFTDGLQRRDFVHVDDVVEAICLALTLPVTSHATVFNIGTGEGTPVRDVIRAIARHYNAESIINLGAIPRDSHMAYIQVAETDFAKEQLGFEARIHVETGLRRLFQWQESVS